MSQHNVAQTHYNIVNFLSSRIGDTSNMNIRR